MRHAGNEQRSKTNASRFDGMFFHLSSLLLYQSTVTGSAQLPLSSQALRYFDRVGCRKKNELAPPHSITSSARPSSVGGTVRPSMRAICALMTNANLLDCTTGKSAGFAPLRMRPV
jgi:hypothetical protein